MYKILILQDTKDTTPSFQYYYELDEHGTRVEFVADNEADIVAKVKELIETQYSKSELTIIMPVDYDVVVSLAEAADNAAQEGD